jgi:hypothetical protein
LKYCDIVSFRKDLLFEGAVQIGWFENNERLANKAAEHYIFHGPDYHGVVQDDSFDAEHALIDTADFTLDILKRVNGLIADEPFALAIAGYGTGKSHLGVTLATLLSKPRSVVANKILANIALADKNIGSEAKKILESTKKPFLVVAINGMKDFYLCGEVMRQIISALNREKLDTSFLENLRPRFKTAASFTESFYKILREEYSDQFGDAFSENDIIQALKNQDETVFNKVNAIYEQRLGSPIPAVGQEGLHEFITVTKKNYCGPDKPFAGIVILFDEFGRYLEFAVQRPHIAGSGALQQLFEAVQDNADSVFLLAFIQYEIKAYVSRIAPELKEDLNRYVSRYDVVRKVKLSTNLETLIANLFEKKNSGELENQIAAIKEKPEQIQTYMKRWFPEINNHALWNDQDRFKNIIVKGCWPLHPISTWVLYKLSSVGKSLQQRSAFSFLADAFESCIDIDYPLGRQILPINLCNEAMINEFLASEQYGQQGATAHAYQSVHHKYQHELTKEQGALLKAALLSTKVGFKVETKQECIQVLALFSGIDINRATEEIKNLESEHAVLEWNETLHRFDISGDSVPKKAFIAHLNTKAGKIDSKARAKVFSQYYMRWSGMVTYNTDFGPQNKIPTKEWHYQVTFSCIALLEGQVEYALRTWIEARGVDEAKGQLIYCYVGPESSIEDAKEFTVQTLRKCMDKNKIDWTTGAPIAVILLDDTDGLFGQKIAEYWVLSEDLDEDEIQKYSNFILDRKNSLEQEMANLFSQMELQKHIVFATEKTINKARIKNMLTQLFDVIYEKRIPFPFDGFHTARGKAAVDCQLFTSELILGRLDQDWISARNKQQRNRAHHVLVESWGIFGEDGSVRIKPTNLAVRNIIELLESELPGLENEITGKALNLGSILRFLCAPPYGCNIASAGLLLALFIGRLKDEINILVNNRAISFENWLQKALPDKFFELSFLDTSFIARLDKKSLSEWEVLLESWEDEHKLSKKCGYCLKAEKLEERVPIPQQLHYRYKLLQEQSEQAFKKLDDFDNKINTALEKINTGIERNDVGKLSWGGADLDDLYVSMEDQKELWTDEQFDEITSYITKVRDQIKLRFKQWLSHLTVAKIEHLERFKHINSQIAVSLKKLNLLEEQAQLEAHVEEVEKNIKLIARINSVAEDVDNMVRRNCITENTPVSVLNSWLEQAARFEQYLEMAKQRTRLVNSNIDKAVKDLSTFKQQCKRQLSHYKERMRKVFDIQILSSESDLEYWRHEIAALKVIYSGQEKDVEDLNQVIKHLDLIEIHFNRLSDYNLNAEEFAATCETCIEETEKYFVDDAPPLEHENIYKHLKEEITKRREYTANEWFLRNVPPISSIATLEASNVLQIKTALQTAPRILTKEQVECVDRAIVACERRLDELELEGLLAKFKELSPDNKKRFLDLAKKHLK